MNNIIKKKTQNNSGSILLITILILSGVMIVVFGASSLIFSGIKMSGTQENSTVAYFIAEAGIERYLYGKKNYSLACSDPNPDNNYVDFSVDPPVCSTEKSQIFNNGTYKVQFKTATRIISTGEYKGVKRIVEVDF